MTRNEDTVGAAADAADRVKLGHALRELEATQARVRENATQVYDTTRRDLIVQLLPVLDNLDRAVEAAKTGNDIALVDGVRIVRAELETVLFRYGVERVEAAGQRFDPVLHEAIAVVPVVDPKLVGSVMLQAAPGYRFGARVLRPAKVSVAVLGASASGTR